MPRSRKLLLLLLLLTAARPGPAASQWERPAIGAAIGVGGGAVVTLSAVVFRARFQREYIDSADDLIHWESLPMIGAPAAGVLFGLAGRDALVGSIVGSTSGMLIGAAIGAGVGWLLSAKQEAPWAGGVIGAGVGLTLGGLGLGLHRWSQDDDPSIAFPDELRFSLGFPVP